MFGIEVGFSSGIRRIARVDAVYPATIVGIPPMEDFYMGGASVKLFLPIFKMNFPEIVDIAPPAEGVFHNLVFVSIRKTYPMQAYKTMHGLWGMGQMMFTKYIIVVDDDVDVHNTSEVLFRLCANNDPQRDSLVVVRKDSPKARPTCSTTPPAKSPAAANSTLTRRRKLRAKVSNAPGHR
jgi:UbiD family decarboxylase